MEMPSRPKAGMAVAALASIVIFAGEIKSGISDGFDAVTGAAGDVVSGAWDDTGIPGLANDAQDCYARTGVASNTGEAATVSFHSGEELGAAHLEKLRKNCASYTGFLEEIVELGLIAGAAVGTTGGAIMLRRRLSKRLQH